MKFNLLGMFMALGMFMFIQVNVNAQATTSCEKKCTAKELSACKKNGNVLAASLSKSDEKKDCKKACAKSKVADQNTDPGQAVLASMIEKPTSKMENCDPKNCDPKNCDPSNCKPSNCKPMEASKDADHSILVNMLTDKKCNTKVRDSKKVAAKL